jgi:hypothetical protein
MKSTLVFCAAVLILMASVVLAVGNIAPPRQPSPVAPAKTMKTTLEITPDLNAWTARLQIPRSSLRQLRASLDGVPEDDATGLIATPNRARTVMAGLCMFLAVSFAGVWLVRSGHNRNQKAVAVIAMTAALVGATAMITRGNAAPPPGWKWQRLSQNLNGGLPTSGQVEVEIVPEGNGIKLIVPMYKPTAEIKPAE